MCSLYSLVQSVLTLYYWVLIAAAIMSWLLAFGVVNRYNRAVAMIDRMDHEGFGTCSNHGECEAACPKDISIDFISMLNRDYLKATLFGRGPATRAAAMAGRGGRRSGTAA